MMLVILVLLLVLFALVLNTKTMKGKIFGIGLPKTGTTSLHTALEILGYKSIHYPVSWQEIETHEVASDISVACRFAKLDFLYPNSKFILTVRNVNEWLQSCQYHFQNKVNTCSITPRLREFLLTQRLLAFGTVTYEQQLFQKTYYRHLETIKKYFSNRPEDLLMIDLTTGQGWDVLCSFFGKPQPSLPFPHENRAGNALEGMFADMNARLQKSQGDWLN